MLLLFDIDGTLISSQGMGVKAMTAAGRSLFGEHFSLEGVEIAGRLDPLIWHDAAVASGIEDPDKHHEVFRVTYGRLLEERLETTPPAVALPGVHDLIEALVRLEEVALGLVTGNYPETGRLKIRSAGIDPDTFIVGAWGSDGATRRDLPPVAIERLVEQHGRTVRREDVVIIGDTPHDVDCARANGCRSIGVATGWETVESLEAAGADLAVEDLSDINAIVGWIFSGP